MDDRTVNDRAVHDRRVHDRRVDDRTVHDQTSKQSSADQGAAHLPMGSSVVWNAAGTIAGQAYARAMRIFVGQAFSCTGGQICDVVLPSSQLSPTGSFSWARSCARRDEAAEHGAQSTQLSKHLQSEIQTEQLPSVKAPKPVSLALPAPCHVIQLADARSTLIARERSLACRSPTHRHTTEAQSLSSTACLAAAGAYSCARRTSPNALHGQCSHEGSSSEPPPSWRLRATAF